MKLNCFACLVRTACVLAVTALTINCCTAQDVPDYKKVIGDYVEATGGEEAHNGIESVVAKGTVSIPEAGIEGEMSISQTATQGLMHMTMQGIGEQKIGFDGETAWSVSEMTGPEIMEGEQRDQMITQMNLSPLMNIDKLFDTVECTGIEEFNGEDCYVLEANKEGQETVYHYFSIESKLHTGTLMTAVSTMGKMEIVSKVSDYREVSGVKMPFITAAELPQGMTMKTELTSIEANTEIDETVFDLPESIQDLKSESDSDSDSDSDADSDDSDG